MQPANGTCSTAGMSTPAQCANTLFYAIKGWAGSSSHTIGYLKKYQFRVHRDKIQRAQAVYLNNAVPKVRGSSFDASL